MIGDAALLWADSVTANEAAPVQKNEELKVEKYPDELISALTDADKTATNELKGGLEFTSFETILANIKTAYDLTLVSVALHRVKTIGYHLQIANVIGN